jgi:hypothetical protein
MRRKSGPDGLLWRRQHQAITHSNLNRMSKTTSLSKSYIRPAHAIVGTPATRHRGIQAGMELSGTTVVLLALFCIPVSAGPAIGGEDVLFESFDRGWESRWTHSRLKKYKGRFVPVTRPSSRGKDTGIIVSGRGGRGSQGCAGRAALRA